MQTQITQSGNLCLMADEYERQELLTQEVYPRRESQIAEFLHDQFEFICPELIGALTDAPILVSSDETWIDDNGDRQFHDGFAVYWFPDYMVRDPWSDLIIRGSVVFKRHRESN